MINGKCEKLERIEDDELLKVVDDFAQAAVKSGWRGPFNVQLKKDKIHGYQAIEFNCRFTGGTSARYQLGFDELGYAINDWCGEEVVQIKDKNTDVVIVEKILRDFPINSKHQKGLASKGTWSR